MGVDVEVKVGVRSEEVRVKVGEAEGVAVRDGVGVIEAVDVVDAVEVDVEERVAEAVELGVRVGEVVKEGEGVAVRDGVAVIEAVGLGNGFVGPLEGQPQGRPKTTIKKADLNHFTRILGVLEIHGSS